MTTTYVTEASVTVPTQLASCYSAYFFFFFFNDTATTEIYTLSLHDALPILLAQAPQRCRGARRRARDRRAVCGTRPRCSARDRKSTRLNSSHVEISYAVFCLKKKKKKKNETTPTKITHDERHGRDTH